MQVLLIDHQPHDIEAWTRDFELVGHTVTCANNRALALEHADALRPNIVVVELFLGRESGLDVVAEVKARSPKSFVVLVSRYLNVAYTMASIQRGADFAFVKPVKAREIERYYLRSDRRVPLAAPGQETATLDQIEWEHIARVILDCRGNISLAADRLGIYRQSLQRKIRKHAPTAKNLAGFESK
jgi:two-component system, response regulator RegA